MQTQSSRGLMLSLGAALAVLTIQGLSGDFLNLFVSFPSGSVDQSFGGLSKALQSAGLVASYHAIAGVLLVLLAVLVLAYSFRYKSIGVRVSSILAVIAVLVATAQGTLFVLSGFDNNMNSALMGYSYIFAYALSFLVLYFARS